MPATVLSMIYDGQRRLEDTVNAGFARVDTSINQLREEAVHRREFDRYRDERMVEYQAGVAKHDRDIAELRDAHERERAVREERDRAEDARREQEAETKRAREDQERRDRRVDWRWRWGLAAGAATAFGAAVVSHTTWHF